MDASLQLYNTVIEKSPLPILSIKSDGSIIIWNRSCENFFGWTKKEALGTKMHLLIIPERLREKHIENMQRYVTTGKKVFVGSSVRVPALWKDGSENMIELHIEDTSMGNERLISAYIKDLSKQITLEEKASKRDLETTETLYALLKNSNFFVYSKDFEGKYTMVNTMAVKFLNKLKEAEIIGKTDYDILPKSVADMFREKELEILDASNPHTITNEDSIEIDGKVYTYLSTRARQTNYNGSTIGYFGFSYDITEYKDAILHISQIEKEQSEEREKQAIEVSKQKSDFLANMSHEIRTPINGVMSLATLLADTELDEEQRDFVNGIKQSSEALMVIINDILDISKIEAGRITIEYIDVDLEKLVNDTIALFSFSAGLKNLNLILENNIPKKVNYIVTDSGRVRQILGNLIGNAIKFTFKGSVTLKVDMINMDMINISDNKNDKFIKFRIIDTGIGIRKDKQKKLFTPFTQADASTSRRFGGTGLGLSISKNLTELLKGSISFQSQESIGSEFWFTIPYIPGKHFVELIPDKIPNMKKKSSRFILVVDDNSMNLKVALKLLEKGDFKCVGCENGAEAVQVLLLDPGRYGLVLMDISMPVMDGYEATRQIRKMPKPLRDMPIIAMTANAMTGERENCIQAGMNDYLSKPINRDLLLQKIYEWMI